LGTGNREQGTGTANRIWHSLALELLVAYREAPRRRTGTRGPDYTAWPGNGAAEQLQLGLLLVLNKLCYVHSLRYLFENLNDAECTAKGITCSF